MTKTMIDAGAAFQEPDSPKLSRAVIDAVADAEGVEATELDPLYDAIDPDKLDALFRPQLRGHGAPDATAMIVFAYHGYEVRATATGQVQLTDG